MNKKSLQSGFTLIETILYVGLFVMIMAATVYATYNMIAATDKSQYRSLIHNEGQFVIGKIDSFLNGASSVVLSGSVMTINYPSSASVVIDVTGDKIRANGTVLNGDIAPISSVTFASTPISGVRPVEVLVSFRVQNRYYDETFTAKKLVR